MITSPRPKMDLWGTRRGPSPTPKLQGKKKIEGQKKKKKVKKKSY
jgi:hypothetical protein